MPSSREVRISRSISSKRSPQTLGQERRLHVGAVLVAVADDEGVGGVEEREGHQELGLAARLEADALGGAVLNDLLDDVALLVDLDGVHAAVHALVAILLDGALEGLGEAAHAARQDVREADQEGSAQSAALEVADEGEQVDLFARPLARPDRNVAGLVDGEEPRAPGRDVVELEAVSNGPPTHRRASGRTRADEKTNCRPSARGIKAPARPDPCRAQPGRGSVVCSPVERSRTLVSPLESSSGPIR
jgi:hypothetical protein